MSNHRKLALLKAAAVALLVVIVTLSVIAGYLLYKDSFNSSTFSNWMFYAAIAYIALAVIPLYDVLTSSNSVSYTYGEYAVKGKIDNQDRIKDMFSKKNYRFSIMMITASALLFVGAYAVEKLF